MIIYKILVLIFFMNSANELINISDLEVQINRRFENLGEVFSIKDDELLTSKSVIKNMLRSFWNIWNINIQVLIDRLKYFIEFPSTKNPHYDSYIEKWFNPLRIKMFYYILTWEKLEVWEDKKTKTEILNLLFGNKEDLPKIILNQEIINRLEKYRWNTIIHLFLSFVKQYKDILIEEKSKELFFQYFKWSKFAEKDLSTFYYILYWKI